MKNAFRKTLKKIKDIGLLNTVKLICKMAKLNCQKELCRIFAFVFRNHPLKNYIVIESHDDFDSNGGAFYDYLIKKHINQKYRIIWALRNKAPKRLPYNVTFFKQEKFSFKGAYYIARSKYLLTGHNIIEPVRKDQISVYMCHGSVSLKSVKGKINLPETINYYFCPSENMVDIFKNQYSVNPVKTHNIIMGYPTHDVFYIKTQNNELKKICKKSYNKVILWMPTFRVNYSGRVDSVVNYTYGIPLIKNYEDFHKINKYLCDKNIVLIIKIHPMQDTSNLPHKDMSNIIIVDGKMAKRKRIDNYLLMKESDALISDYSSCANDYLHLNKPLAYAIDDIELYKNGFIVDDPTTFMAGNLLYTVSDLITFIEDVSSNYDRYTEKRAKLLDYIFKYHDGNSCKRFAQFLRIE